MAQRHIIKSVIIKTMEYFRDPYGRAKRLAAHQKDRNQIAIALIANFLLNPGARGRFDSKIGQNGRFGLKILTFRLIFIRPPETSDRGAEVSE